MSKSTSEFRMEILKLQDEINNSSLIKEIIRVNINIFKKILGGDFSVTTVAYLRAVRPSSQNGVNDFLGFHRERFYSDDDYIKHQVNIHVPVYHYDDTCCMKYIPFSHLIEDSEINVKKLDESDSKIIKGSTDHKLGFMYAPKIIESGVDLKNNQNVQCKLGQLMLFNSNLIHGGGNNTGDKIRFSIDFGLIPNEYLKNVKLFSTASYHISKKPYVPYEKF